MNFQLIKSKHFGTLLAHNDGGVPNMVLNVPELSHHITLDTWLISLPKKLVE